MATEVGSLVYNLDINDKKLKGQLDDADRHLKGFGSKLGSLGGHLADVGKKIAVGLAIATAGAVAFGVSAVKSFSESQNVMAQTEAVLKSTGGVAGVTSEQVQKLASSFQRVTKFTDEQIQSGQNLLLTFTKIGKDVFPQATEVMLDMSQALGQDLKSSSIQLGKALQDPIQGVTALRRVGVNFSEAQQDVIKNLVNTGRAAEAQQLILKELQTEFGGSARAAGETFAGKLAILKNSLDDVKETIGGVIVTALVPLTSSLADVLNRIDWTAVIEKTKTALLDFWNNTIVPTAAAIQDMAMRIFTYLKPGLEALWNTLTTQVIPTLSRLWHEVIEPLIPVIGAVLVFAIKTLIDILNAFFAVLSPIINWMLDHKGIVLAFAGAFTTLAVALRFNAIASAFSGAMDVVIGKIGAARGAVGGLIDFIKSPTAIGSFGLLAAAAIAAAILIVDAANKAKAAWDRASSAASSAGDSLSEAIRKIKASPLSPEEKARRIRAISGFAGGVTNFTGGLAYVHQGELLVNLPKGTDVISKQNAQRGASEGSGDTYINIGTIEDRQDADYILRRLDRNTTLEGMGLSPAVGG